MSIGLKIGLLVGVMFVLFGFGGCAYMFSVNNVCVAAENGIEAQYKDNQNNLSSYTNKIMEMVQVPKMAKEHIADLAKVAIEGRYGDAGVKAFFVAINEQNPTMDPQLYTNIQQAMESGRDNFEAHQKTLLERCRVYKTYYQSAPQSFVVGLLGYPKFDKTNCDVVIRDDTAKAFETKRANEININ